MQLLWNQDVTHFHRPRSQWQGQMFKTAAEHPNLTQATVLGSLKHYISPSSCELCSRFFYKLPAQGVSGPC